MEPRNARPRRRGRLLVVAAFALVALMAVTTFAQSAEAPRPRNDPSDPRNQSRGEIHGAVEANDCWNHHKPEGMRDVVYVYPVMPQQLKLGERREIPVQIANPWRHELRELSLEVSLLGEQRLTIDAAASNVLAAADSRSSFSGCLGPAIQPVTVQEVCPTNQSFVFDLPAGARAVVAHAELYPATNSGDDAYAFGFRTSVQTRWSVKDPPDNDTRLDRLTRNITATVSGGDGVKGILQFVHVRGSAPRTALHLNVTVVIGSSGAGERTYQIPLDVTTIAKYGAQTVPVKVTPFQAGTQQMEFKVRAHAYYEHQEVGTPNDDVYTRVAVMDEAEDQRKGQGIIPKRAALIGDSYIPSAYEPPGVELVGDDWKLVLGETSGFAAAGLLLPSLLLGGTYGKSSRRLFNNLLGGAKRRVMFHNMISLALSLVAIVHVWLFMLEVRYTILMGVLWGGLGALSLLVLGLTGYYQVPLIQRRGYKWWRTVHLVTGLLVMVFVGYHAVADGPDFFFLKEKLPQWLNEVNLSQK